MKYHNRTLLELEHKVNLSQVGACASCHAAEFHGTKQYAREAVAKHRAISADVRRSIADLMASLDRYDAYVEESHAALLASRVSAGG